MLTSFWKHLSYPRGPPVQATWSCTISFDGWLPEAWVHRILDLSVENIPPSWDSKDCLLLAFEIAKESGMEMFDRYTVTTDTGATFYLSTKCPPPKIWTILKILSQLQWRRDCKHRFNLGWEIELFNWAPFYPISTATISEGQLFLMLRATFFQLDLWLFPFILPRSIVHFKAVTFSS